MTRRDAQERDRRAFGTAPILLPVAKRVDADPDRQRELGLGEPDEPPEHHHVFSGFEPAENEAPAEPSRDGQGELAAGESDDRLKAHYAMISVMRPGAFGSPKLSTRSPVALRQ